MVELIYSFLLQSGFPRASIVFDVDLLQVDAGEHDIRVPSLFIVDPNTADPLAVVDVVPAVDAETLKNVAIEAGAYASRLAGKHLQGFVVRVDGSGQTDAEQVQFYKIWPNSTLQQLSSKTFPDLDTLRVARMLLVDEKSNALPETMNLTTPVVEIEDAFGLNQNENRDKDTESFSAGLYLPAFMLLLLFILDAIILEFTDSPLITVAQSVLALGAAALLTLPSALRFFRN